jgi:toxin HigB-1
MILNFRDRATEDQFHGIDSKAARTTLPAVLRPVAVRKLDHLNAAHDVRDLRVPPGNHLEALKGDWKGFHSIRINDQFRVVFRFSDGNAHDVIIVDYHR